jgi:hypothetical protein
MTWFFLLMLKTTPSGQFFSYTDTCKLDGHHPLFHFNQAIDHA